MRFWGIRGNFEVIVEAGIRLFVLLYGAKERSLNVHRYFTYNKLNSSSKTQVKPEKLPPTEVAAEYHSLRVHCQIIEWKSNDLSEFRPTQWGWKNIHGRLEPIDTTLEPGPPELLNVIRCNCKLSTKTPCGAGNCSCRKNGLPCVAACGHCHGNNCTNVPQFNELVDDDDECFERNAFELFEFV